MGTFRTSSDTEVVLRAYGRWGAACLDRFSGMFAFALWDEREQELFCARDRFGIKPLYYAVVDGVLYFASEVKALLPFLPSIETDPDALKDYLTFQFCLGGKTLFKGVSELPPGHFLRVRNGTVEVRRYWEVYYEPDFSRSTDDFRERTRELVEESVALHLRADVPVGAYVSGGLDSSAIASLASVSEGSDFLGFTGKFDEGDAYDESRYARDLAAERGFTLHEIRDRRAGLPGVHRARRLSPRLPGRRAGLVPAVHGLRARSSTPEGGARRAGRRRDLRRLRPLPDRLLRAVHQGRHRRHHARRQLRRHLRVDHPQPHRPARVQAACSRSSGARGCSRISTGATSGSINRAHRPGRRGATGTLLGDYSPFETLPGRSSTATTSARSRTSTA